MAYLTVGSQIPCPAFAIVLPHVHIRLFFQVVGAKVRLQNGLQKLAETEAGIEVCVVFRSETAVMILVD